MEAWIYVGRWARQCRQREPGGDPVGTGVPNKARRKWRGKGKKWTYMVRRAIGRSLCVYVCVCVCYLCQRVEKQCDESRCWTPAIDFAPRFANFFESDFTGTFANPPSGDILFLPLIEQESSKNQVFRAYSIVNGWWTKGRRIFAYQKRILD